MRVFGCGCVVGLCLLVNDDNLCLVTWVLIARLNFRVKLYCGYVVSFCLCWLRWAWCEGGGMGVVLGGVYQVELAGFCKTCFR